MALGAQEYVGGQNGWLLIHHEHDCPGCKAVFRCTAPECAAVRLHTCIACQLDAIEARERAARAAIKPARPATWRQR